MVVLFSAMGILLWVGFLLALAVLFGVIWVVGHTIIGIVSLVGLATRPKAVAGPNRNVRPAPRPIAPPRNATPARKPHAPKPPAPKLPAPELTPDIMPKWNAAHRRYVDRSLADWQEQFDALNRRNL
jgi:hypothetical protein